MFRASILYIDDKSVINDLIDDFQYIFKRSRRCHGTCPSRQTLRAGENRQTSNLPGIGRREAVLSVGDRGLLLRLVSGAPAAGVQVGLVCCWPYSEGVRLNVAIRTLWQFLHIPCSSPARLLHLPPPSHLFPTFAGLARFPTPLCERARACVYHAHTYVHVHECKRMPCAPGEGAKASVIYNFELSSKGVRIDRRCSPEAIPGIHLVHTFRPELSPTVG